MVDVLYPVRLQMAATIAAGMVSQPDHAALDVIARNAVKLAEMVEARVDERAQEQEAAAQAAYEARQARKAAR